MTGQFGDGEIKPSAVRLKKREKELAKRVCKREAGAVTQQRVGSKQAIDQTGRGFRQPVDKSQTRQTAASEQARKEPRFVLKGVLHCVDRAIWERADWLLECRLQLRLVSSPAFGVVPAGFSVVLESLFMAFIKEKKTLACSTIHG